MLTSEASVDSETEGLAAGADDYILKPVEPRRLAARVKALLATGTGAIAAGSAHLSATQGIRAMKNLKVWQRFVLMATVTVIPFALVTYKMVESIDTMGVKFAQQELRGLDYYRPLIGLLKDLQQHRGMAATVLSGDASFKGRLESKRIDIENDIEAVNEADQHLGTPCAPPRNGRPCGTRRAFCSTAASASRPPRALRSTPR